MFYLYNVTDKNSTVTQQSNTIRKVTPVTYIRPDILIFTGVIHKEGDTSDSYTSDIHKT